MFVISGRRIRFRWTGCGLRIVTMAQRGWRRVQLQNRCCLFNRRIVTLFGQVARSASGFDTFTLLNNGARCWCWRCAGPCYSQRMYRNSSQQRIKTLKNRISTDVGRRFPLRQQKVEIGWIKYHCWTIKKWFSLIQLNGWPRNRTIRGVYVGFANSLLD